MSNRSTDILIIGGGAAGMSAALAASETAGRDVTIIDDNPRLGGQIWRAEMGETNSSDAAKLIAALDTSRITIINNAQVFDADENSVAAETPDGRLDIHFQKLVIATGARERFLPFPGWTLPNIFGAAGLQALVKGGFDVSGKRILIAGTGPLLLVVAEYLKTKGAVVVAIAEQAAAKSLRNFTLGLWRSPVKIAQGVVLKARIGITPYLTGCWIKSIECGIPQECRSPRLSKGETSNTGYTNTLSIILNNRETPIECDYAACGFHLVPNIELAALLGCDIGNDFIAVDVFQQTSIKNIYAAGEPTGIGGVEASLVEGRIAGYAAASNEKKARSLFTKRNRTTLFTEALNRTFTLRDELRSLAADSTIVCRCEDVQYSRLTEFTSRRAAKLQTRCGMGACQGRVCGAATEFLFGWEADTVRPPIFPVRLETL